MAHAVRRHAVLDEAVQPAGARRRQRPHVEAAVLRHRDADAAAPVVATPNPRREVWVLTEWREAGTEDGGGRRKQRAHEQNAEQRGQQPVDGRPAQIGVDLLARLAR